MGTFRWMAASMVIVGTVAILGACGSKGDSTDAAPLLDAQADASQDAPADTGIPPDNLTQDLVEQRTPPDCSAMAWQGDSLLALEGAGESCANASGVQTACELKLDAFAADNRETLEVRITLRNEGTAPLQVRSLEVENQQELGALDPPPFAASTLNLADSHTLANGGVVTLYPASVPECGSSELTVVVTYLHRQGLLPKATLTISTDAVNLPEGLLVIDLIASGNGPKLSVKPKQVIFENVELNDYIKQPLEFTNVGNLPLFLNRFELVGDVGFEWVLPDHETYQNPDGGPSLVISPFVTLEPGQSIKTHLYFYSLQGEHWATTLRIYSNDPYAKDGFDVPLLADVAGGCAMVHPTHVDFATQALGDTVKFPITLSSCEKATQNLVVTDIRLAQGAEYSDYYSLDLTALPNVPSEASPLVLEAGQEVQFDVVYKPESLSMAGQEGPPAPHRGLVQIVTDQSPTPLEVALIAMCEVAPCPKAVIQVPEGDFIYPGTELHLFGNGSAPATGNLLKAKWEVKPPSGGLERLKPNDTTFDVTYLASLVGVYDFTLDVWDQDQTKSCKPANFTVTALPYNAVYVQLTWQTPGDSDESDTGPQAGSDLDLHFAHLFAEQPDLDGDGIPDPWFDNLFDCYWFNPVPSWGLYEQGADSNPIMVRDDADGAGPEVVALNSPENDITYSIGVHYWDQHGYGEALARVRVYLYGALVYDSSNVVLQDHDMWYVARLHWPSGLVDPVVTNDDKPLITPQYQNRYFAQ